jgi:hypothetical protein
MFLLLVLAVSISSVGAQESNECVDTVQRFGYDNITSTDQLHRVNVGMFVPSASSFTNYMDLLVALEDGIGLPHGNMDVLLFLAWGDGDRGFPADLIAQATAQGRQVIITSEPWARDFENPARIQPEYSLASIAAGNHDEYLREWARQAANLGIPFIYRFAQEQSIDIGQQWWYPWQGDPEGYVEAYRHIHTIFMEEGATMVRFMWSAMWLNNDYATRYYPGDDVVDLIGTTVLNHGDAIPEDYAQWFDFDYLMRTQYEAAERNWPNKPLYIAEMASAEQGGSKADWILEGFSRFAAEYTRVEGVMLIQGVDYKYPMVNWSINSSIEALAATQLAARCFINR